MRRMARVVAAMALAAALSMATDAVAQTKVRLAVGGQSALYYLPLTVTDRLGYFKDEGLNVEISDLSGGARALQALMGGSADVVTGSFNHTIQMQAKNRPIMAVVQLGRFPGFVLALTGPKAASYKGPANLKGMKIGVTALGNIDLFVRSICSSVPMYSPDGGLSRESADTALNVLREFDASVRIASIDVAATYTHEYVDKALTK
ncbi:MAG: hypothetical protein EXQ83_00260 [Xanthobacteraceae bacterium]|nr:hypothetical protein [Xanthobacteraceae bacterium]